MVSVKGIGEEKMSWKPDKNKGLGERWYGGRD